MITQGASQLGSEEYLIEKAESSGCQGLGREGNGELLLHGYKVAVMQDEKVLNLSCATLCLQLTILYYTLNC